MNKKLTYIFTLALLIINGMAMAQQQAHVTIGGSVFGGGNLAAVGGNTRVLIGKADNNVSNDTIKGDVYGGGALADVGTNNDNDSTTVTIFKGVVLGDVYGGGLGDSLVFKVDGSDTTYHTLYHGDTCIAALVHNKVYVNIGGVAATDTIGKATIKGSVFGCNNINGTPLDSVFVNIYKTAHTTGDYSNHYPNNIENLAALEGSFPQNAPDSTNYPKRFAIKAVYGGGNKASYKPIMNAAGVSNPATPKCTTVHVFGCTENTIQTIYGGGNAANVGDTTASGDTIAANTRLIIEGGRYDQVFGGGNGFSSTGNHDNAYAANYNPGANIFGTAVTEVQGGLYRQVFGGSNQYGDIDSVALCIDNQCEVLLIHESFGGANEADITSNISTTLLCNDYSIGSFYGGSNKADINGNVTLNVRGGNYTNVFGGSKGTKTTSTDPDEIALASADIFGDVTLNLHGGTMENAFGGSDVFGSISGAITVNVWDTVTGCPLQVDTIYGGGQDAAYAPDLVAGKKIVSPLVNLWKGTVGHGTVKGCVFGGGKGAGATVTAHPKVVIGDTIAGHSDYSITVLNGNVFGGGNAATVDGIDSVLMLKANSVVSNLFGGGNAADADTAVVMMTVAASVDTIFGGGNLAGLSGTAEINVSAGTVKGGIYGGSNKSGNVAKDIVVNVLGGTVGADNAHANIHGGGYGAGTSTTGLVNVNFGDNPTTHSDFPKVYGDIYGGSALGCVNAANDTTMVNVLNGTVYGDIYGGGLGDNSNAAIVNGKVYVNIGGLNGSGDEVGEAIIEGSVYGCNNANGSPQDSVFVNVYKTYHNANNSAINPSSPVTFAIANLYGGGNQAPYIPTGDQRISVVIHTCDNTIEDVFGGGDAASVAKTSLVVNGGRFNRIFAGGNGENDPADIGAGGTTLVVRAGKIHQLFGGSNMQGSINGPIVVDLNHDNYDCVEDIDEFFGGSNEAVIGTELNPANLVSTIACGVTTITDVYGGSNKAEIYGNVTLNINGGTIVNAYGGSKGEAGTSGVDAKIHGDVNLNLYGGTIRHAFGGSNLQGNVFGQITVNVLDTVRLCPLALDTVYGGGNLASYTPTSSSISSPLVNIINGTVNKYVYGGGLGESAIVKANPVVKVGYDAASMATLLTPGATGSIVASGFSIPDTIASVTGEVYGGGDAASVTGSTSVTLQRSNSSVQKLFGGGNQAGVTGTATVTMNQGFVSDGIYGGCNSSDTVGGNINVYVNGGQVGTDRNNRAYGVFGGGFGNNTETGANVTVTIGNTGSIPVIYGDVYGGSAQGDVNKSTSDLTKVWIKKGTIVGDVYGGGFGDADQTALVKGNVQVIVDGGTVDTVNIATVGGRVFGCNNAKGTPQGTVEVTVNATDTTVINGGIKVYALKGVYGGGNLAHYNPTTANNGYPKVNISGCKTSIEDVFGGGNAAAVPQTDVTINGGDIKRVFAGGNGESGTPAHVGYNNIESNPSGAGYGTGQAQAEIKGGTIVQVFGGSNANGKIRVSSSLDIDKNTASGACDMKIAEVYGGGNQADGNAGSISIGCTGTLEALGAGEHYGIDKEGIRYVYGGANQADIGNNISLAIHSGIVENVFGGNNMSGNISGTIQVEIDSTENCGWYVGNVFGGGNVATYSGTPAVNIKNGTVSGSVFGGGNEAGVGGGNVTMTGGTVMVGLYGGCNSSGVVGGDIVVSINGGTIGSYDKLNTEPYPTTDVYGGGYGKSTSTSGDVRVNINGGIIYGDVYGGSALGEVNASGSDTTTVNINGGTLETKTTTGTTPGGQSYFIYHGGNVYGGGLGRKADDPNPAISAEVNGKVFVNIGFVTEWDPDKPGYTLNTAGDATIKGNIYGCNNTYGSPQDDVVVNVYQTAHTPGVDGVDDGGYALANVFGGGNEADFTATGKTTTVNIYSCDNTIQRTFGGSNAAASNSVTTMIQGGRIHEAYGGGNGEVQAANVNGSVTLAIHGGTIGQSFSGSNQNGVISETSTVTIDDAGCGGVVVDEHFCGGNFANWEGNINATIECTDGMHVKRLYGGCKQANVVAHGGQPGNVHLTVKGGTYEYIYGGSQGYIDPVNPANNISANIAGNVQLDIFGGTVTKAIFGGSHILGKIEGTVIVNVEDRFNEDSCPLDMSEADVYGGGNQADYPGEGVTHEGEYNYPQVNIKNATVKNVFGGGLEAEVKGNPQIKIKKVSKIRGNVYGGGNMGEVDGDPKVIINGKLE